MSNASLELSLFGQKIRLKHKTDDPERVKQVAALVTAKVKEAQARTGKGAAPHHVTLVALMDLAAEYLDARARTEEFKREVDLKASELISRIEGQAG